MSIKPTFSGEVQFRRYSDTSTQGVQIVLSLHDREALEPLVHLTGKRFMAVLVQIGDDEMPVQPPAERVKLGNLCREAIGYCEMLEFQEWVPRHTKSWHGDRFSEQACKDYICSVCGIDSRKELDMNDAAAEKFVRLIRVPFMKREKVAA